MTTLKSNIVT